MFNNDFLKKILSLMLLIFMLVSTLLAQPTYSFANNEELKKTKPTIDALWKEPNDISSLDLYLGEGGIENMPVGPFKYLKKDTSGTQEKFTVEDAKGIKWKAKIGEEAQPETVAVRLLWAAGYYTDLTYYLPKIQVDNYPTENPKKRISKTIYGARMELVRKDKRLGRWKWHDNPFIGTKEFDGLKVMMILINNWDLKQVNNVALKSDGHLKYYVSDLGASFGKAGVEMFGRSKNNIKDFSKSKFIENVDKQGVDFAFNIRPLFIFIFHPTYYFERTKAGNIAKNVPVGSVKWIGSLLSKLSDKQLMEAFRSADYKPEEAKKFVSVLRNKINHLTNL
ncbi:MAG: hypothetical protein JNM06_05840 [Blastocatellia bacterium]|nr:hypothetical protein [Blastocatellia bacterium]